MRAPTQKSSSQQSYIYSIHYYSQKRRVHQPDKPQLINHPKAWLIPEKIPAPKIRSRFAMPAQLIHASGISASFRLQSLSSFIYICSILRGNNGSIADNRRNGIELAQSNWPSVRRAVARDSSNYLGRHRAASFSSFFLSSSTVRSISYILYNTCSIYI